MRCPHCGSENPNSSINCEVCGSLLPEPERPIPEPEGDASRPHPAAGHPSVQGRPVNRPAQGRPANRPGQGRPGAHPSGRPPVRRKKKKTRWNPKFLAACAGILLVLILIPILIAIGVHRSKPFEPQQIQTFYAGNSGRTCIVVNGKVYEKAISGKVASYTSSRDGMVKAALSETGELYYITSQKMETVASGVQSYVLSADGSKLAYVITDIPDASDTSESSTEEETTTRRSKSQKTSEETTETTTEYVPAGAEQYLDYTDTSLFLYNGADGTSALIANHVPKDSVSLSPTGASVGYTVSDEDGAGFEGFYYRDGVASSTGRSSLPIAVSDDAVYLYYVKFVKSDDVWIQKLFFKNGSNEIKLDEFSDGNKLSVFLNLDYTQIVYSITGTSGAYFYCGTEGEKNKIGNGYTPIYAYGQSEVVSGKAVLTPYETFAKTVYSNAAHSAQYLDAKCISSDLGAVGVDFRISPDGKRLYYMDKDEYLYSCNVRKAGKNDIAPHVMTFELSADGDYLYYVNSDNELHAVKGNKDTTCAKNVYTSNTVKLAVTDGGYVYFLQDYAYCSGTLCYLKGDGKPHELEQYNNVYNLAADAGDSLYFMSDYNQINGSFDLFYGKLKKFTQMLDNVE